MTKRLEEIGQLRVERLDVLKLDHYDCNEKKEISIQDVELLTQQKNNHTIELTIFALKPDIQCKDSVELKQ